MLDADGNGKRDAAVEPDQPVDPQKDKRIPGGFYRRPPQSLIWLSHFRRVARRIPYLADRLHPGKFAKPRDNKRGF